ncbi:MAG: helix-turn-helix domain-containing protein [Candidatus Izemoplasmatales bacterium]
MTNHYTTEFKLKIVKMILEEQISKHEIEREYKVARKTQRDWVTKYGQEGITGLINKKKQRDKIPTDQTEDTIEDLKHQIFLLKIEIERLKKGYSEKDVKYLKKTNKEI